MPVTITRKTLSGFAVAAAIAIALSACSQSDGAENTSSGSNKPSSSQASPSTASKDSSTAASHTTKSASPTPVAASSDGPAKNWPVPKMPSEAKKKTPSGAKAFAEYYFQLVEYSTTTNDPKPVETVTETSCEFCATRVIGPAKTNRQNGTWNVGGDYDLLISSAQLETENEALVDFSFEQAELKAYTRDGKLYATQHPSKDPVAGSISMAYDEGWHTTFISIAKS